MNPMTLYTDQVIFRMQRMGGVSVYCEELFEKGDRRRGDRRELPRR